MRSDQSNIEWYREEAARVREVTTTVHDESVRRQLLDIAHQYEMLAKNAETLLRRSHRFTD